MKHNILKRDIKLQHIRGLQPRKNMRLFTTEMHSKMLGASRDTKNFKNGGKISGDSLQLTVVIFLKNVLWQAPSEN